MRRFVAFMVLITVVLSLCGCTLFSETYVYERPHQGGNHSGQTGQQIASSYPEIISALSTLVAQGESAGVIILSDISEQVGRSYMLAAVKNLMLQDPVAAFAVEKIDYDFGTNAGRSAVAVQIGYSRSRADIAGIKTVENMNEAEQLIGQSLEQSLGSVVFRVAEYEQTDFAELVMLYAESNASMVMEAPQVMTAVYPHSGSDRLVELIFTYQNPRDDLLKMQALVRPVFTAAELYVHGNTSIRAKYQQLYSFLMERTTYKIQKSETIAYSLLQEGIGDAHAFACVYKAICDQAGLDCRVINGTKDGNEWSWNRIVVNNRVYYIDLIEARRLGHLQLRTSSEMAGYEWKK